ncbi:hypothetical protein [Chryseosolibacter indicus]|uniref:Uncharacterized protein n=1 Tax=Chryseosolibacter indicus TaxID=2782351 RepID=A0ABS5VXY3_9BACT|nr:hypothetical protein [Chryseosolibacter indicus]MBT1706263.1 hypothetical protein [Chryseosolibacter indicus]
MRSAFALYVFLTIALLACKKPALTDSLFQDNGDAKNSIVVFHTSLADTLPEETTKALNVGNVTGIKVLDLQGRDVRYFHYKANKKVLLEALAKSPFNRNALLADTLCREISREELVRFKRSIADPELHAGAFFWNKVSQNVEIYESVKPPLKHLLIIDKSSRDIHHRIEFI